MRRTSPNGAKYRHGRNACLQEHFDEAAYEPIGAKSAKRGIPPPSDPYEEIPPLHSVPCSG